MEEANYRSVSRVVGIVLFMTALVFMAFGWDEIVDVPRPESDANAIEQLVAARPVAISLRVGLIILTTYVLVSVAALVVEGRWLVKAGPTGAEVEPSHMLEWISRANSELDERLAIVEETLDDLWDEVDDFRHELLQDET